MRLFATWRGEILSPDGWQENASDHSIYRTSPGSKKEQRGTTGPEESGEFILTDRRAGTAQNDEGSGDDRKKPEGSEPREKTKKEGEADGDLSADDECRRHVGNAERGIPIRDGRIPTEAAEQSKSLLAGVVKKDGGDGDAKDERPCASVRVEKLENRISSHAGRNYQIVIVAGKQKCSPARVASLVLRRT